MFLPPNCRLLCCWLILLLGLSAATQAEQLDGLYDVTVAVNSQSQRDLNKAGKVALLEVFTRVTGSDEWVNTPALDDASRNAKRYLKKYSYSRQDDEEGAEQLLVTLEFEEGLVNQVLRNAGLPIWSANRPSVLLLWVVLDKGQRSIVSAASQPELVAALQRHATRRGVVIKLPLMDLEDNIAVSANDLWNMDIQRAHIAAQRYGADSLLVGRASHLTNGKWLGNWQYRLNENDIAIDSSGDDVDSYIAAAIDAVARQQASAYAIAPVRIAEQGVLMRLENIKDFRDYARVISYLEALAAIQHANVVAIEGDEIIVQLTAEGQLSQLRQALALDNVLIEQLMPAQSAYDLSLNYRWPNKEK